MSLLPHLEVALGFPGPSNSLMRLTWAAFAAILITRSLLSLMVTTLCLRPLQLQSCVLLSLHMYVKNQMFILDYTFCSTVSCLCFGLIRPPLLTCVLLKSRLCQPQRFYHLFFD